MLKLVLVTIFFALPLVDAYSQVYLTKEKALEVYFPDATVERKTVFLTDEQVKAIQNAARAKVPSRLVTYYVGRTSKGVSGYAFFDTHVIRTMPETFMTVVAPDGSVRGVEILAFYEPEDYLPPKRWLATFDGKSVQSDLWLKRGVQNIVGATLSAQAITDGVRVMLAVFEHAVPKEQ